MAYVLSNKSWHRSLSIIDSRSEYCGALQLRCIPKFFFVVVVLIAFGCSALRAQNKAPQGTSKLAFDAVSVRPSNQKYIKFDFLGPGNESATHGGLFSWNVPITFLIGFAYEPLHTKATSDALAALPKWTQQDFFAVEARAEGNPTRAEVRQMVRAMLEERFQFTAHVEKRDGEVFALTVAKQGLGLKPHPEGAPCELSPALMDENKYPHAYPTYKQLKPRCGVFNRELSHVGERRLEMLDVTMQQVADSLMQQLPMVDRTGLEGHYDAVLDFGQGVGSPTADTSDEIGLPTLAVALEKQLGMKLVKQNAPVDVFVVDHIGTLSEN